MAERISHIFSCPDVFSYLASRSGASMVGFTQEGAGATMRSIQDVLRERVSVRDFGAVGDGATDDKNSINSAIAFVNAMVTPAFLVFPPGTYLTTGSLTPISNSDTVIVGYGAELRTITAGVDLIKFYSAAGTIYNCQVRGLRVTSNGTGNLGIGGLDVHNMVVDSVSVEGFAVGIDIAVYQYPKIVSCNIDLCTIGIQSYFGDGMMISCCRVNGSNAAIIVGTKGINLRRGGGTEIVNTDVTRYEKGLSIEPISTDEVNWSFIANSTFDSGTWGVYVDPVTASAVNGIFCANSWFSTNNRGFYITQADGVQMTGCIIFNNTDWGGVIENSFETQLTDCMIHNNNVGNAAGVGGLLFTSCDGIVIEANRFINRSTVWTSLANQKLGALLQTSVIRLSMVGNQFYGHASGDIAISATITTKGVIRDNVTNATNQVASSASITLPEVHDVVHITGTTSVTNIVPGANDAWMPEREFVLITDGNCTISHGNNFLLAGAANFVGTPGSRLTLMYDLVSGKMAEKCRTVL